MQGFDKRRIASTPGGWVFFGLTVLLVVAYLCWKFASAETYRTWLFKQHKEDYETLVNMLDNDQVLTFINSGLTTPEDPSKVGISPQRIAEYRRYMSKVGCGSITYDPGGVLFTAAWGETGILFSPGQRPRQDENRLIEGDWYLAIMEGFP